MLIQAFNRSARVAAVATFVVVSLLGGMSGVASANGTTPDGLVNFVTRADDLQRKYAYGFDGSDADLSGPPDWVITPGAEWFDVRKEGFDPNLTEPELVVQLDQCLLLNGTGNCQDNIAPGAAFSGIVTLTFDPPTAAPDSGFLLLITGLNFETEPFTTPDDPFYPESEVAFHLNPQGGSPLQTIMNVSPSGTVSYYLGVRIDSATPGLKTLYFRYEAASMVASGQAPVFRSNVIYDFVPEPGTGLLVGLGLAGLGMRRRR